VNDDGSSLAEDIVQPTWRVPLPVSPIPPMKRSLPDSEMRKSCTSDGVLLALAPVVSSSVTRTQSRDPVPQG